MITAVHLEVPMTRLLLTSAFLFLFIAGCQKEEDPPTTPIDATVSSSVGSCVGCHTNYSHLRTVHSPDTVVAAGGCGGETPHIEPYDRVYITPTGYAEYSASSHSKRGCTYCHNGVDNTSDKKTAHSGDFLKHPSDQADKKCVPCHYSIQSAVKTSIHLNGWGQKSMVALRYGVSTFEELPADVKHGYEVNCATCHGGCGSCHVLRPTAGGGGLLNGHAFRKRPDMRDNCTTCHSSRGGHAYFGVGTGTIPDVHLTALGDGHCLNCHTGAEMHGDGYAYDQRYKMPMLPKCENCHANVATSNAYHQTHIDDMNCNACHSQDYNNCGSCHIHGAGARIPSYQGFKIALNPIPQTRPFKWATVRRSLMAPDSWKEYGVPNLANFDVRPTYKYSTPHNIKRWTSRTQVSAGAPCYDACHIMNESGVLRNKQLYLFNSDLESWELNADKDIVVDGKLPASWNVQ